MYCYWQNCNDVKGVAEEIKNGGQAIAFELDISNLEDIDTVINQAIDQYLRIDILLIMPEFSTWLHFLKHLQSFDILFSINVKGTFFAAISRKTYG